LNFKNFLTSFFGKKIQKLADLRTGRTKRRPVSGSRNGVSDSEAVTGRRSKQIQDMPLHDFIRRNHFVNLDCNIVEISKIKVYSASGAEWLSEEFLF